MVSEGADIIDVGGESTRPGYTPVSEEEEIGRVLPVIERIKGELDIPVSVDTCKAGVAYAALKAGADMVNDIWGFKGDKDMARVAAEFGAACCLMHNRERAEYSSFISEVKNEIDRMKNEKAAKEELDMVKNYMIGDICRAYENALSISEAWIYVLTAGVDDDFFDRSVESIRNMSEDRIMELANRYLDWDRMVEVVAGNI